jgi:hypothetical protein
MDLPYLIKFINSKLSLKYSEKDIKELRATMLCLSAIRGENAKHIFGGFFENSNIFRYTKKMMPIITVESSPFGKYVSKLQFDDMGVPNETRVITLNEVLNNLNYREFINIPELDFSEIENFKF